MSRRKSLYLPASESPAFNGSDNEDEDEEEQKRLRRNLEQKKRAAELNKSKTIGSNKTISNASTSTTGEAFVARPNNQQLSELYTNCVKLLNENKINAKNAFQLPWIDYMSDIVLSKDIGGGVTNFQVVGCTIDVGTKIYAARVDALHQNTYKMLSGLGNNANQDDDNNDNNMDHSGLNEGGEHEDEGDTGDPSNKRAKVKRKRIKKSSIIAENLDSITQKIREDYKDEDSYFAKVSTYIENESIAGMLTNKLTFANDSGRMLINAEDKLFTNKESFRHRTGTDISQKDIANFYKAKAIDCGNFKLCSENLLSFRFIGWNLETNDDISQLVESMSHAVDDTALIEEHRFDANNLNTSHLNVSTMGNNAMGVDNIDMDMDFNEPFDNIEPAHIIGSQQTNAAALSQQPSPVISASDILLNDVRSRSIHSVAELSLLISQSPSDYSYFDLSKLKMHDLPRHLKLVASRLVNERRDGQSENGNENGDARTATVRSRRETPRFDCSVSADKSKFFKVTRKAIFIGDKTLEKRNEKPSRTETEREVDFSGKELFRPYHKAITAKIFSDIDSIENLLIDEEIGRPRVHQNDQPTDDEAHFGMDDYEIPFTAATNEPFFSQNGGEFMPATLTQAGGDPIHDQDMLHNPMSDLERFDGTNLIDAPLQVNVLNIEYAKTSKNIDVRKLKQVIWQLLLDSQRNLSNVDEEDKENNSSNLDVTNDQNAKASSRKKVDIHASLKAVYKLLKPPLISAKLFDDLSICIVFQMLLFLANEHNLILKNDPIGSDVIITNY
jgi:condensin complex subunit 2